MECEDWSHNSGPVRYGSKIPFRSWIISHRGRKTEVKKILMFSTFRYPTNFGQSQASERLKYDRAFYHQKIKGRPRRTWHELINQWEDIFIAANSHAAWSKTDYRLPKKARQKERIKLLNGGCYDWGNE